MTGEPQVEEVLPESWLATVGERHSNGFRYFDWLGCTDEIGRSDTFRVTVVLRDLDDPVMPPRMICTAVPRSAPVLDSIGSVFAGASWHERESAELFGLTFRGGDTRRLLLSPTFEGTPLRKDAVLAARAAVSWPGAKEPGETAAAPSRRRMVPPGVPDPAVWGDRDSAEPPADAAEVAGSAVGGRVRRRSR